MFGYNPTVQDRSGEIRAAGTIAGANALANGISQAGQNISGAINVMNELQLKANQANGAAQAAHSMGLIDDDALQQIQNLPWQQKIGMGDHLTQMVVAKNQADKYAEMMGIQQGKADAAANKSAPVTLY